jgi:hypothetical protein
VKVKATRLTIAGRDGATIAVVTVVVEGEEPWISTHDITEAIEAIVAAQLGQIKAPAEAN